MTTDLSKIKSEHFCIAPWVNLHINQRGMLKPCCGGRSEILNFGTLQDDDWSYINGTNKSLHNLKQTLLSGEQPEYCKGCFEKGWYDEFHSDETIIENINDFVLKSMDIRWGTTCQLSCTYCDQGNSTTWANLIHKKNKTVFVQPARAYRDKVSPLLEFIEKNSKQIKRISLLGGEPLLLKETIYLLEILSPDTIIEIITNLNVNLETNEIYQQLIQRKKVNWYVSMENVGQRFEFVRRGAEWQQQVHNLKKLESDVSGTDSVVSLQSQYCVYNALNLEELYEFVDSFETLSIVWNLSFNYPHELDFFKFPNSFKELAITQVDKCIDRYKSNMTNRAIGLTNSLNNIRNKLEKSLDNCDPISVEKCIKFHKTQENSYFENRFDFLTLWPQFYVQN